MSIAVLRLSAIGDAVLCASMVLYLAKNKNVKVYWITTKQIHNLLGDIPGIEFIVVPKPKDFKSFFECRKILKAFNFDTLLLAQASFSAHFVSIHIKAKRRIGFDVSRSKDLHGFFINESIEEKKEHFLDAYYSFAFKVGIENPAAINWDGLFIGEKNVQLRKLNLPQGKTILAVNPSASKIVRNWTTGSYSEVIDYAHEKGLAVVVIGGDGEDELSFNNRICSECRVYPVNLTGQIELAVLPYLIKKIDFLLAPDTGAIHIARAVNTPVIGLYAVANPKLTGPFRADEFSINKFDVALNKFNRNNNKHFHSRIHHPNAMGLIQADEVMSKIDLVIAHLSLSQTDKE